MKDLSDKSQIIQLVRGIPPVAMTAADFPGLEGARLSLAQWLDRNGGPVRQHPRLALFASEIDGYGKLCLDGTAPCCALARQADADMRFYDLSGGPANDITMPIAYGMMAVEPGVDLLAIGGISDDGAMQALNRAIKPDADFFRDLDDPVIAALSGAIVAARLAGLPVILDGAAAVAAVALLCTINPAMADHCATSWKAPDAARPWFRARTKLLFLPSSGENAPGCEGVRHIISALSSA